MKRFIVAAIIATGLLFGPFVGAAAAACPKGSVGIGGQRCMAIIPPGIKVIFDEPR